MTDFFWPFLCGCGSEEPDEYEIERILREIEEADEDVPEEEPIPVPAWPTRREVEVE